jgi:hypothetical protein
LFTSFPPTVALPLTFSATMGLSTRLHSRILHGCVIYSAYIDLYCSLMLNLTISSHRQNVKFKYGTEIHGCF